MRRFASVFAFRKPSSESSESSTEDRVIRKKSWKKWLPNPRQPAKQERHDDDDDELDTTTLLALTRDSLAAPATGSPSPFVQADGPLYPRSANVPVHLAPRQSLRVRVLKSSLLRQHGGSSPSPFFAAIPANISRPNAPAQPASRGIHRWTRRPCFEERCLVYLPSPSGMQPRNISASLAIAALEYSEHLDAMAQPVPVLPVAGPPRDDHIPPQSALATPTTSNVTDNANANSPANTVKRIVRFAQDHGDPDESDNDTVPLHFIRQKNKRQEKAKFLQQERLQRLRKEEEDQKRQAKEAAERERRRSLLETERAQVERERKEREQTTYAEQVIKARIRREMQRAGGVPALVMKEREHDFGVSSSASERKKLAVSHSTASLRGVSSSGPPSSSLAHHRHATSDYSPSNSRPSSLLAPSQSASPLHQSHSRPPSNSSSSESGGKRNSFMIMPSPLTGAGLPPMMPMHMPTYAVPSPMIMTYPYFATSNPNLSYMTPVVPSFPNHIAPDFDMPLLPPAAPFMKQPSYEKRKNSASASGSKRNASPGSASTPASTDSSRRGSFSSSSEKLVPSSGGKHERGRWGTAVPSATPRKSSDPTFSLGRRAAQTSSQSMRSASGTELPSKNRSSLSHALPVISGPSSRTSVPTAQQMQMEKQMQVRGIGRGVSVKTPMVSTDGESTTLSGGPGSTSTRRGTAADIAGNRASYSVRSQRQVAIS